MRYLNPRLRQNYFRFEKTDGRHIGILLPASTVTYGSHRHGILLQIAQFHCNQTIGGGVIISIFHDGSHRVGNLLSGLCLMTALAKVGENLFAYQILMRYLSQWLK